jgi:nicotinamidase-related amidase
MTAADRLEFRSTALVLNDLQLAIISGSPLAPSESEALARVSAAVDRCAEVLGNARRVGIPVVHVRVAFSSGHPEANPHSPMMRFIREKELLSHDAPGTGFDPRVQPGPGEIVVTKHGVSAFAGTPLDQMLRSRGVDTVVLGGLVTHYAIDSTARDAHDRGYRVIVLEDGCASATPARHDASLANLAFLGEVLTTKDFIAQIALASGGPAG